jgi:hypothetical protein
MQNLDTTPQHYFPGANISTPLPDEGVSASWSNEFAILLPPGPAPYDYPGGQARPANVDHVSLGEVLWNITGEGKWVDIWVLSYGLQGLGIILYEQNSDGDWAEASIPNTGGYMSSGSAQLGSYPGSANPGNPDYHTPAAFRVFLKTGLQYVLVVGPGGQGANVRPDLPHNYGAYIENFDIEVSYTPLQLPDLKTNAYDVIIPSDGSTYTSPNVLNTNFTTSAEDPQGTSAAWLSAWWKYTPLSLTDMTVSYAVVPQYSNWFRCVVWLDNNGTLVQLGSSGNPPETFTVPAVAANSTIYIQIFAHDYYNKYQPYAQKYQLEVTGAKSLVQHEDTNLAPPNDLRPNAIAVSVSSDDNTYLSDDVTLTYATPGAVSTVGPYITDPEAPPLYQTAWWSYQPIAAGSATFRAHSTNDLHARVEILDENLSVLGVTGMGQSLVFDVAAGVTYYVVLGTADPTSSLSASFSVVGPPTGGIPPINDLRSHAITVFVAIDGGTYLATDTQLDYATPVADGAQAGPYVPDPEAPPLYQTAWWVYKPLADGQATIRAHSSPADDALVKLMVLHNSMQLAMAGMGEDITHDISAGETYYYVLGTTGQAFVSASFGLTGTYTASPDHYTGPWKFNLLMPDLTWKTLASGT